MHEGGLPQDGDEKPTEQVMVPADGGGNQPDEKHHNDKRPKQWPAVAQGMRMVEIKGVPRYATRESALGADLEILQVKAKERHANQRRRRLNRENRKPEKRIIEGRAAQPCPQ